jgi:hypothetical protein
MNTILKHGYNELLYIFRMFDDSRLILNTSGVVGVKVLLNAVFDC